MRIFKYCFEATREAERDLWEMGVEVWPETMQDKDVRGDEGFKTKEVSSYSFMITNPLAMREEAVLYFVDTDPTLEGEEKERAKRRLMGYCRQEIEGRTSFKIMNPGTSWKNRPEIWEEFIHEGKFAYSYYERISPQLPRIIDELGRRPNTRQAIINIHSNFYGDIQGMGGHGRVPCSMYYQVMRREGKLNLIYCMRSCDLLIHFPVDVYLAIGMQKFIAKQLKIPVGQYSMFMGSFHAYYKDIEPRGIF